LATAQSNHLLSRFALKEILLRLMIRVDLARFLPTGGRCVLAAQTHHGQALNGSGAKQKVDPQATSAMCSAAKAGFRSAALITRRWPIKHQRRG
jgi:hypothetical protein